MNEPIMAIDEPFRSLWSGADPFVAVEVLEGEVFRELEARRTLRTEERTLNARLAEDCGL